MFGISSTNTEDDSLALVLVFAVAAVSLAVPVVGAAGGQLVTFVDRDWETNNIGAGYGITDDITLGAVYDMTSDTYGAFANLTLNQLAIQAEVWCTSSTLITVTGLWNFALDPLTLGIGGGLDHGPWYDDFFLSAAVSLAVGENLLPERRCVYRPVLHQSRYIARILEVIGWIKQHGANAVTPRGSYLSLAHQV